MTKIKLALGLVIAVLTALWWLTDTLLPQPLNYFSVRSAFIQYSGVLAMGCMSVAMLLALRPRWLEPHLDGLDKMYRLHKWLGIASLVAAVLHWWWAQGTKWMVGWGWLTRPARGARASATGLEGWLRGQRGLAEEMGEWAFYVAAALIVLALIKRFPYRWFAKTHRLIAVAYLALAWHTVVLTRWSYWREPVGWALAGLLVVGCAAALLTLLGRIGASRRVQGTIESLQHYPELDVLETRIGSLGGWPGHAAGQFAFVTSDPREGAHPYTMASAWDPGHPSVTFITKALGDHTAALRHKLQIGMPVTVEGPYGCFRFDDQAPRQIWIGAGIGITPFIARMKQLAGSADSRPVDLFHPTAVYEQAAIDKLRADAAAAGIRLHVLVDAQDGRLDGQRIRAAVPQWRDASLWFCGPASFGQQLRSDFVAHGLPANRFHQELFNMR